MNKIEIDILSKTKLNKSFDIEPSYPIINHGNLIVGLNSINWDENGKRRNEFSVASFRLLDGEILWETKFESELPNGVKCDFIVFNETVIGCASYELFGIDVNTGRIKWKKEFKKHSSPKLSIIGNRIFWSNWGELNEINPFSGQKINSIKPRVKWFDSSIVENDNRYFIATSNSKIFELNIDNLKILHEFEYKGGWAIGCKPYFFRNLMISNSYGASLKIFNLNDNTELKSFNRKSGAKPIQNGSNELFLSYHGNSDNKLNCYDVFDFKKLWSTEIERIQYIYCSEDSFEFIYKENEIYKIGKLYYDEPNKISVLGQGSYTQWNNYKFDLWEGVSIVKDESYEVYVFEPNKILCITMH